MKIKHKCKKYAERSKDYAEWSKKFAEACRCKKVQRETRNDEIIVRKLLERMGKHKIEFFLNPNATKASVLKCEKQ